jgi:hypothetical protein
VILKDRFPILYLKRNISKIIAVSKKEPGDPRPTQRILHREPLFVILIQEISNLIESKIVGQDIYSYAFHVCLK